MTNFSTKLKRCFPKPFMVAYKRPKNIRDILVRAKLDDRKSSRMKNGFTTCTRPKRSCYSCIQCDPATSHKFHRSGESWKITAPLDCESTNVIYKLACRKCREFVYIGETKRKFCQRLADHRGYIKRKVLNHPVENHFNQPGHDITNLIPLPIEKVFPEGNHQLMKQREKYWIQKYDSVCNGANSRE